MTLIELIVVLFWLGCGVGLAVRLAAEFGPVGGVIGFVFGVGLSFGSTQALVLLGRWWRRWRPLYPVCVNGTCGSDDYSWQRIGPKEFALVCRCGTEYVEIRHRLQGRQFKVRLDGTLIPYMRRRPFGRWRREVAQPQIPGAPYRMR